MKRITVGLLLLGLVSIPATASADRGRAGLRVDLEPIVQEWNEDGSPTETRDRVGWAVLVRSHRGLDAVASVRGLRPGGVYTFWWIVPQGDGVFPDDVFVAGGGGAVVGRNGRAIVRMHADRGQPGIRGFTAGGDTELGFAALREPRQATVRIEIAYHGQAKEAGADLGVWLEDFWTGTACPPEVPNPNPAQPHCPVYFAATFE